MLKREIIHIEAILLTVMLTVTILLSILPLPVSAAEEDIVWREVSGTPLITFKDAEGNALPDLEYVRADSANLNFDSAYVTADDGEKQRYASMDLIFSYADYDYLINEDGSNYPDTDRMIAELKFQNQIYSAAQIICGATAKNYLQVDVLFEDMNFFDDIHNEVDIFIQYCRKDANNDELSKPSKGTAKYTFARAAAVSEKEEENDKLNIELVLPTTETEETLATATPFILIDECTLDNGWSSVVAGSSFELDLICRNSHKSVDLNNVLLQVDVPDGLKLEHPSNTFYIGKLGKKERFQQELNFSTSLSADVKNYSVGFSFSYEYIDEEKRKEDKITMEIQIPVHQPTRFAAAPVDTMMSYTIDEKHEICSSFANLTRGNIYNVTATLVTDAQCPQTVLYLGNLSAGEGGTAKFSLLSEKTGFENGEIIYTYESEQGQKLEERVSFMLEFVLPENEIPAQQVKTEYVTDLTAIDRGISGDAWYGVAGILIVLICCFVWAVKNNDK